MTELLTVGEFSRLTRLTVKALRHYHEEGVLTPDRIDARSGYRYYSSAQADDALLVRRLREVRMPLADVRSVLAAPDADARQAAIVAYLEGVRRELVATAAAVASLQALLTSRPDITEVRHRLEPARSCLAATADLGPDGIAGWCAVTYPRLYGAAAAEGLLPGGPAGMFYGQGWFEQGHGEVTAYLPVDGGDTVLPEQLVAVVVHAGPYSEIDRSYAVLGRHVLDHGAGAPGPIREVYLNDPSTTPDPRDLRTEVCWPITRIPKES